MSDFQRLKAPEKRISLAEMARAAAQRSASQPPPAVTDSGNGWAIAGRTNPGSTIPPGRTSPTSTIPPSRTSATTTIPPAPSVPSSRIGAALGYASGDDSGFIDLQMLRPLMTPQAPSSPPPSSPAPSSPSSFGNSSFGAPASPFGAVSNRYGAATAAAPVLAPPSALSLPNSMPQRQSDSGVHAAASGIRPAAKPDVEVDPFHSGGRGKRGIIVGALIATAGIGAALFIVKAGAPPQQIQSPPTQVTPAQPAAEQPAAPAAKAEPEQKAEAPAAQPAQPPAVDPPKAEPPAAQAPVAPVHQAPHTTVAAARGRTAPAREPKAAPEPKPAPEPKAAAPEPKAAPEPPAPKAAGGDPLAGAIRAAVGPIDKPAQRQDVGPAAPVSNNSDVPESPGKGAIQGALSGPRAVAKTCLEGSPANVTVIFGSDGKVQTVNVTGAGGAAECVKKAFARANVGPFRRSTFPVSVKITP